MQRIFLLVILDVLMLIGSIAIAHPGHRHRKSSGEKRTEPAAVSSRQWTIPQASAHEQGTFVMARDGFVQIRREDDSLVDIPLAELSPDDQEFIQRRVELIRESATQTFLLAQADGRRRLSKSNLQDAQPIVGHFDPFVKLKSIKTRWDDKFFYVESNGIPAHQMMVGITAWQQQVPIPQKYVGDNAWQIPLHPVPAKSPATTKNRFLRGAIAVAVNGIPIFNPLNNRGDDAYLFGELDEFGGHCGRADDYHYHLAPVHLEETVGKGNPIAYALDGYPIYGYQEPDAPDFAPLDKLNGHKDAEGRYHYHATKTYPYLNGGFYGEVVEKEGQVDPQPRAEPLRPSLPPLRDAKITAFQETKPGSYRLTYDVQGKQGTVSYHLSNDGSVTFEFIDPRGRQTTETYAPRRRGPAGKERGREDRPPRDQKTTQAEVQRPQLEVSSSSTDNLGRLDVNCTCDGKRQSPNVTWKGAPAETKTFAISLWHTAPDQEKSYWVVYNVPASTSSLLQNEQPPGTVGINDRRKTEYDPMCSKGPGEKTYHVTVFALSRKIDLSPKQASRANLLAAIKDITLAEGTLDFTYERKSSSR